MIAKLLGFCPEKIISYQTGDLVGTLTNGLPLLHPLLNPLTNQRRTSPA